MQNEDILLIYLRMFNIAYLFDWLFYHFHFQGGDDRRVVVWNVEKCVYGSQKPITMKGEHRSNIFCTVFDNDNKHIFSAGRFLVFS